MKTKFTVSELARLFNLNKQTLHFYDKKGIFKPSFKDKRTGYRQYEFNQVYSLALISYLRRIGFSLERIAAYMNLRTVDSAILQLKKQSEELKIQYHQLLTIDDAIQRKVSFVEQELPKIDTTQVCVRHLPKRYYIPLGEEDVLYTSEIFYFYPTIAFYEFDPASHSHKISFGAYLPSGTPILPEYAEQVRAIPEQDFLCFYHRGPYSEIAAHVWSVRESHSHMKLACSCMDFNIVDQFLEKNPMEYVTFVQIPVGE